VNCTRHPIALAVAGALLASAVALPADAQAQAQAQRLSATQLDTITVTAQRRSEDVLAVPLPLSVIDGELLAAYGASARDVLALGSRAPSVQAESSFGRTFPRFYIRGLGNTDFDLNASQPVSMVYDDVVLENPTLKGFPIFDIDRVEVLRGPQGTLFGRNTPAGVITFDSVRPDAEPSGFARLGYGRFDTVNFEGALGGAVSDTSSARLSALYQRRSGISSNTVIDDDRREGFIERAVRGQWLFQPSDTFEALFQVRARHLDGGSQVFQANLIEPGSNNIRDGFNRFQLSQDAQPTLEVETQGASARLAWDLGAVRLVSISAWESVEMFARGDVDGGFGASFAPPSGPGFIPFPAESGDGIPAHRQLTQEVRLESTGADPLSWQAGVFFYDENLDIDNLNYDTLAGSEINGVARQRQDNRAYAAFGSVSYAIDSRWRVAGGLRFTRDEKDFVAERLLSPIGAGALAPITRDLEDDNLSGDLSATYSLSEREIVYARLARGFRAPSVQGRLLFGDVVSVADSETILSWELGYRGELFDRRLRLGVNAFRYALDDAQLTAVGGETNFNTLINANKVVGKGVEVDIDAVLSRRLTLSAAASFNDTEIQDSALGVVPCGSGCTVLDPAGVVPGTVSIDGNRLPQSPRWIANVALDFRQPVGAGEFFALVDASYRSAINFFLYRSLEFTGDPLTEVGLRLGYRWGEDGRYEVAGFGRNVLDETEILGGVDFNNLTGFVNEPRVLGVEVSVRY
jgi:iron complex outermembrane receptor protein